MTKYDFYWCSNPAWWHYADQGVRMILNEDAPEDAQESYRHYLLQLRWHSLRSFQDHVVLLTDKTGVKHLGKCTMSCDEQEKKCCLTIADKTFDESEVLRIQDVPRAIRRLHHQLLGEGTAKCPFCSKGHLIRQDELRIKFICDNSECSFEYTLNWL